jgi:hypothetical protein
MAFVTLISLVMVNSSPLSSSSSQGAISHELFSDVMAATVMGILTSMLQPGLTAQVILSIVQVTTNSKRLENSATSFGTKWVLSSLISIILLIVTCHVVVTLSLNWLGCCFLGPLLGGASLILEQQLGMLPPVIIKNKSSSSLNNNNNYNNLTNSSSPTTSTIASKRTN